MPIDTQALTAENTYTKAIDVTDKFSVFVSGTFVGTITLQGKQAGANDSTYVDLQTSVDAPVIWNDDAGVKMEIRAGFKTGEYTSGTANVTVEDETL